MAGQSTTSDQAVRNARPGSAAIAEFLDDREFGPERRLPSAAERDMIQDAIEGFVTYEQWLPFEQDQAELVARIRAVAATANEPALSGAYSLLTGAANALTELGQRLALQRHAREIMHEDLVQQGEALAQAKAAAAGRLPTPLSPRSTSEEATPPEQQPNPAEPPRRYQVKFWRSSATSDRMSIEVAADSPEAARAKVLSWGQGDIELTPEEEATETLEREELQDSAFDGLLDPDEPYAVPAVDLGHRNA